MVNCVQRELPHGVGKKNRARREVGKWLWRGGGTREVGAGVREDTREREGGELRGETEEERDGEGRGGDREARGGDRE